MTSAANIWYIYIKYDPLSIPIKNLKIVGNSIIMLFFLIMTILYLKLNSVTQRNLIRNTQLSLVQTWLLKCWIALSKQLVKTRFKPRQQLPPVSRSINFLRLELISAEADTSRVSRWTVHQEPMNRAATCSSETRTGRHQLLLTLEWGSRQIRRSPTPTPQTPTPQAHESADGRTRSRPVAISSSFESDGEREGHNRRTAPH